MSNSWFRVHKAKSTQAVRKSNFRPSLELLEDRRVPAVAFRSIDGTGNNLLHPEWGSTDEQLLRVAPAAYSDGIATPGNSLR